MGGRGRGRGLSRSMFPMLGPGEVLPTPRGQPPPPYPVLEHTSSPLILTPTIIIQHAWKEDFLNTLKKNNYKYHWEHFPNELRPGPVRVRRTSANASSKTPSKLTKSIDQYFEKLEKNENAGKVKVEVQDTEEEDKDNEGEGMFDEEEEETDYNQNYFDNGENYLDDDDDMDEGPVY